MLHRVLLAAAVPLLAGHAQAQQDERIGGVDVHLQADFGFATLRPEGGALPGALVWACGGDPAALAAGVYLDRPSGRFVPLQRMAWRFDQDAPDTATLQRRQSTVHLLWDADAARFTRRARTAERLTVRALDEPAREYAYSLAGVDAALSRLGCGAGAEPATRRAGERTLLGLVNVLDEADTTVVTGLAVEELPRLLNASDLARQLERNYPPLLRDAGVSGDVVLRFRLLEDGRVDAASIQTISATDSQFVAAAERSVGRLRFRPARINGRPVKVWVELPIAFSTPPLDTNPRLRASSREDVVEYTRRHYPRALLASRLQGQVVVRFRLLDDGRPDPATVVIVSSTDERFNEAALGAAPRLRYRMPSRRRDGQPEEHWWSETIHFSSPE